VTQNVTVYNQYRYFVFNAASNHALVEVAESKAKLRKLRQQLEEKTEQLAECREELEKLQVNLSIKYKSSYKRLSSWQSGGKTR
jgi:flagellar motility protein MotE (MotC chaperone)